MSVLDRFRLDGRVVVVTGGTGLYGTGFSRAYAEAGARVVITSRESARAREAAARLRAEGLDAHGARLDQSDEESVRAFVAACVAEHGAIDVLVNNAVHRAGGALLDTTADQWDATSATNSRGLFLLTREVVAHMTGRGSGVITNIGSIYGLVAPTFALYEGLSATTPAFYAYDKAGMVGLTRYLAAQLGPAGITVNCVCPGGLADGTQDPVFVERYAARTPLRRMADQHDVEGVLVLLASPAGAYVTGQVIAVDGGFSAL